MWNALKNDFTELVNVVKEDTGIVLENANTNHEPTSVYAQEAERRKYAPETYREAIVPKDEQGAILDEDELKIIHQFLDELKLDEKEDEIQELLQSDEDLKEIYDRLVATEPQQVKEDDFWERYYFHCDEDMIERLWLLQEERAQESRAALIGNVTNMIGGAAKTIVHNVKQVADVSKTGRPPFVLNTAVDEDDDEEELGWDDDDEDDDSSSRLGSSYVQTGPNSGNLSREEGEDTIVFKDEALERAQEQLKIVIEERDQLQQTVSLQNQELQNLRNQPAPRAVSTIASDDHHAAELEKLLASKDKELVDMQSKLEQEQNAWALSKQAYETTIKSLQASEAKLTEHLESVQSEHALQMSKLQQQLQDAAAPAAPAATSPKFETPKQTETPPPPVTKLAAENDNDDDGWDDWE